MKKNLSLGPVDKAHFLSPCQLRNTRPLKMPSLRSHLGTLS
uniref:Uncharacterized protein n=1 Tax=Rhizophora mucronata TaxID=61149 RepID=A0A2P2QVM0_RHIMU